MKCSENDHFSSFLIANSLQDKVILEKSLQETPLFQHHSKKVRHVNMKLNVRFYLLLLQLLMVKRPTFKGRHVQAQIMDSFRKRNEPNKKSNLMTWEVNAFSFELKRMIRDQQCKKKKKNSKVLIKQAHSYRLCLCD